MSCSLLVLFISVTQAQEPAGGEPDASITDSTASATTPQHQRKKVIEWAAVEQTTAFMREHIRTMEQLPFDGLIFHLKTDEGVQMVWDMWSDTSFAVDQFSRELNSKRAVGQ